MGVLGSFLSYMYALYTRSDTCLHVCSLVFKYLMIHSLLFQLYIVLVLSCKYIKYYLLFMLDFHGLFAII